MTFNAQETGARTGRKVFLYTWQRGSKVWRYTGSDHDLVINFQTYLSSAIDHDESEQGPNIVRMNKGVRVPMLHPVALLYRAQAPVDSIVLTIAEHHAGDPDSEVKNVWHGRIVSAAWNLPQAECELTHAPTHSSMQRNGLRRRCQKLCPLVLGGAGCGVNLEAFKLDTTAGAIAGLDLTAAGISGHPDGYWSGGKIRYEIETGVLERRGIRSHVSGTITLTGVPTGLALNQGVGIYPGCDHTTGVNGCAKFGNLPRYGGYPNFARKNPFANEPVY